MKNGTGRVLGAVTLLLLLFGLSTSAATAAEPVWTSPPADLSAPSVFNSSPGLAVTPDGTVVAVWSFFDGTNAVVQVATRPLKGSFGAPVTIPASCENAAESQVAVAPDGTVIVVWTCWNGPDTSIQLSTRPPGGTFGTPVELSAPGDEASTPQLAVSPDGTITVIWRHDDGGSYTVRSATRPAGGSFGTPVDLTGPGTDADGIQLAASPDGTVTAVWFAINGGNDTIQATTRPPGGSFGPELNLPTGCDSVIDPQIAASPDGSVTAVWTCWVGMDTSIQATTWTPGGSFGTPVELSDPDEQVQSPQIAISADGTATVVWQQISGGDVLIMAVTRPPGGSFDSPERVSELGVSSNNPRVVVAPDGSVTVAWIRVTGADTRAQVVSRSPGGDFGIPLDLSDRAVTPHPRSSGWPRTGRPPPSGSSSKAAPTPSRPQPGDRETSPSPARSTWRLRATSSSLPRWPSHLTAPPQSSGWTETAAIPSSSQ